MRSGLQTRDAAHGSVSGGREKTNRTRDSRRPAKRRHGRRSNAGGLRGGRNDEATLADFHLQRRADVEAGFRKPIAFHVHPGDGRPGLFEAMDADRIEGLVILPGMHLKVPGVGEIAVGFAGFAFTHAGAWLMIPFSHDGLLVSLLWLAAFGCCRTRRQCFLMYLKAPCPPTLRRAYIPSNWTLIQKFMFSLFFLMASIISLPSTSLS